MTDAPAACGDMTTSALSETGMGPSLQMNVLEAARAAAELAAYVGACPTCLAWEDPEAPAPESQPAPGRAACPTCGRCSVEWDLAHEIDERVEELRGLLLLDEAVQQGDAGQRAPDESGMTQASRGEERGRADAEGWGNPNGK